MACAALPLCLLVLLALADGTMGDPRTAVSCDVVVAGGSTASLAAAITAAEAAPELSVCFTEITDWPGWADDCRWCASDRLRWVELTA